MPTGLAARYGTAVVAIAAALGLRLGAEALTSPGLPTYITFYPAILAVALLAGLGPGLLAIILTVLVTAYWILPPAGFAVGLPVDYLGIVLFTGIGIFLCVIADSLRRSHNHLEEVVAARTKALEEAVDELAVANRALQSQTRELIGTNDELHRVEEALREREKQVRLKLESILSPEGDINNLELEEIVDVQALQALMDDFHKLVPMPLAVIDLKGKVLVGTGWQEICTHYHRIHPETHANCLESDVMLTEGILPGEFKLYKCKNNMWDVATPIRVGGEHVGNLFSGQFFFDDEPLNYEFFRSQAQRYGFNEESYIAALERVPRLSRDTVNIGMAYITKFADMISKLSYSNIKLARSLAERDALMSSLRESELFYRQTLESIPGMVFTTRPDGYCDYQSQQWVDFTGVPMCEHLGDGWNKLLHPDDRLRAHAAWRTAVEGRAPYDLEYRVRRHDGVHEWFKVQGRQICNEAGEVVRWFGTALNIDQLLKAQEALCRAHDELGIRVNERTAELATTVEFLRQQMAERERAEIALREETHERLRAVEALRDKEKMLLQQNRLAAMGDMINNIAHQWRQPLNIMAMLAQQLRLYFEAGTLNKEFMESNLSKSMGLINHMSQTIDDFRNFFRTDKERAEFRLHEVVARTVSFVEDSFNNQQIGITLHASANPTVIGFQNEYSQVLLNILMNARDALLEHRPENAMVTLTISKEGKKGVVTIADNAGGIPDGIIGRIFDPYFTTKGADKGTGVGLFMSKTIIEKNMDGSLTVRNTGEGAEFRIEV